MPRNLDLHLERGRLLAPMRNLILGHRFRRSGDCRFRFLSAVSFVIKDLAWLQIYSAEPAIKSVFALFRWLLLHLIRLIWLRRRLLLLRICYAAPHLQRLARLAGLRVDLQCGGQESTLAVFALQ